MRALLSGMLYASVLFAPWWVPAIVGTAILFRFAAWEVILAGLVLDLVYGVPGTWSAYFPITLGFTVLFFALQPLRARLISA